MRKRLFVVLSILITFIVFLIVNTTIDKNRVAENIEYLESIDLYLKGRIINKKELGRGSSLLLLDVISSNYIQFDDRNREQYFLVIENKKAEIYLLNTDNILIGDTLIINNRRVFLYRENNLIMEIEGGVGLTPKKNLSTHTFYKEIQDAHSL